MSYQSDIEILQKKSLLKDSRVFFRDYVNNRSLNPVAPNAPQVTHTRSTTASYTNSAGLIASAAIDEARFDFEPDLRTSKLMYSQDFDNAAWVKTNSSVTANATTAPDATVTADKLIESVAVGVHAIQQNFTAATTVYTFSVSLKASERTWALVRSGEGAADGYYINLSSGVIGSTFGSPVSYAITSQGSGWYRLSVTVNRTAGLSGWAIEPANGDGGRSYTGDGTSGIFIWGAQLEVGGVTPYQATPNSLTPPLCKGLLIEEARTNLYLHSSSLGAVAWTRNLISLNASFEITPDGASALKCVPTAALGLHGITQSVSPISGTTYALSIYAKASEYTGLCFVLTASAFGTNIFTHFNLLNGASNVSGGTATASAVSVGNGWWRCSVVAQATATVATTYQIRAQVTYGSGDVRYTGDGTSGIFIWGAQLEAGAFPTSYIPTTSAAVTRGRDELSINTTETYKFTNNVEGTALYTYDSSRPNGSTSDRVLSINGDNSNTKSYNICHSNFMSRFTLNGVSNTPTSSSAVNPNTIYSSCIAYSDSLMVAARNGEYVSMTTGGGRIDITNWIFGTWYNGYSVHQNGHVRKIAYYNKALSPRLVKALSQTT